MNEAMKSQVTWSFNQEERKKIDETIHPGQYSKWWEEIVISDSWKIKILWTRNLEGIEHFQYVRERNEAYKHLLERWKIYIYDWKWDDHMWCWFELVHISWTHTFETSEIQTVAKSSTSREITSAIEKICNAANAAQKVPELSDQVTEICMWELQRITEILWIDWGIQIKKKRSPWISQFEDLIRCGNIEEITQKVYIDITRTNYLKIRGTNRRDIFLFVIKAYFERNNIKYSQKEILEILEKYWEPMSANTISLVFSGKQGNQNEFAQFINVYISWEESPELEIEEIY